MKPAALLALVLLACCAGCGRDGGPAAPAGPDAPRALPAELRSGHVMAVSYSGFRAGQHPDRGAGASNPDDGQVLEDLRILVQHGFTLLRLYDSRENTRTTLELIRRHRLPLKVVLGIWLDAEYSNHEGCSWLTEPIPEEKLAANARRNAEEVLRGIELARQFDDIVVAVNVGNEVLVDWTDHMVPLPRIIAYLREVRAAVAQPVTVADSYPWWTDHGASLAAEVDFAGVHTYPVFEHQTIDQALPYMDAGISRLRAALRGKPVVVLEAGWPSVASEFPDQASEANQSRHYKELRRWAVEKGTPVFIFEAFDEPWKGNPDDPLSVEKHWGLFNLDRSPKAVMK
jgi:exo-beta-1,3-glucanase (GH17 family)